MLVDWFADQDKDSYGDPASIIRSCAAPQGYVSDQQDCDDTRADINPDAEEVCDGVDNDCDGDSMTGTLVEQTIECGSLTLSLGSVAPDTFLMGSPEEEVGREPGSDLPMNETQHEVTLTRGFEIAVIETTQAQFQALMGHNPSVHEDCNGRPVEQVSWSDAAAFANRLSIAIGIPSCYVLTDILCEDGPEGDALTYCRDDDGIWSATVSPLIMISATGIGSPARSTIVPPISFTGPVPRLSTECLSGAKSQPFLLKTNMSYNTTLDNFAIMVVSWVNGLESLSTIDGLKGSLLVVEKVVGGQSGRLKSRRRCDGW